MASAILAGGIGPKRGSAVGHDRFVFRPRDRRGASTVKFIVWVLVIFAVYSGYKFMGVTFAANRVERAVQNAITGIALDSEESAIQQRVANKGSVAPVTLAPENVRVVKEKRPGQRIIHVDLTLPIPVDYLGSERIFTRSLQVTRVISVDEAALARQEQRERQRMAAYEAQQAEAGRFHRKVQSALEDCEDKWGKGNCTVTEMGTGGSQNSIVKMY